MIDILHKHLNKYLIKIIEEYNEIDLNKLILNFPKKKIFRFTLREYYTIEDLIIKSFHLGYKGFFIPKCYFVFISYFSSKMNNNIRIYDHNYMNIKSYNYDKRNIEFIDVLHLKIYKTVKC